LCWASAGQAEAIKVDFIKGIDRGQSVLFPDCLDGWIEEGSLVCVVDLFVGGLIFLASALSVPPPRGPGGHPFGTIRA
jgi:hypothetical protein